MEIKQEEVAIEKEVKNNGRTIKIVTIIIGVFLLVALIVIKMNNPAFSKLLFIVLLSALVIICVLIIFLPNILAAKKKNIQTGGLTIPAPATLGELLAIAENALTNRQFANHLKGCKKYWYEIVGKGIKNRVFIYHAEALYKNGMEKGEVYIIINAHYPLDLKDILIDPSDYEIRRCIQTIGTDPREEAGERVTHRENPLLGTTETIVERRKQEEVKTENKKEEEETFE
jgi:hypothetical protein